MPYKPTEVVHLDKVSYPDAVAIMNELAEVEERNVHETAERFIKEEGPKRIARIKAEKGL